MSTRNGRVRGASSELVAAARDLRARQTPAERILWDALRGRKLDGFKFRRQYPLGSYVLDFVCVEQRLVVELDGAHHAGEDQLRHDQQRTAHLEHFGYRVVRYPNAVILSDLDTVLDDLRFELARKARSPR